jgi:phage gp36-like protein
MSYATAAQLSTRWGAANIKSWSDLDGAGVIDNDRVAAALAYGDSQVNFALIGSKYAVPLEGADDITTLIVQDWSLVIAGHWLYFSRGLLDKDEQATKIDDLRKGVEAQMLQVRQGNMRLNSRLRWGNNPTAPSAL